MADKRDRFEWSATDRLMAADGRAFGIFDEHIRGEGRWYYAREELNARDASTTHPRWSHAHLPFDGAYRKDTVKRRVERYVRETTKAGS